MPRISPKQPQIGSIVTVQALYDEVQDVIFNAKYLWNAKYDCTTQYRMRMGGKVELHCGKNNKVTLHKSIMDDNIACFKLDTNVDKSVPNLATNVSNIRAYAMVETQHFDSIVFYMKLRWLLKCHSGLCELDNNFCSMKKMIQGMHALGAQESERVPCDSSFETRRRKQNYRPRQLVEDIFEQLERGFGKGFEPFMTYIASCDYKRALNINRTDIHQPRLSYNDKLEIMIEEIFLSDFCDMPMKTHKFSEILADIEAFHLPVPRILPMKASYVHDYMAATSTGGREAREKGAQYESIHICVNMDIEDLGSFCTDAEIEDQALSIAQGFKYRKVMLPMALYEAAFSIIGHKLIFREGIRNRVLELIKTRYDLDDFLLAKLVDLTNINLDSHLLTEDQLHKIIVKEKEKMCRYFEVYHRSTLAFLAPSTVGPIAEAGADPRYWRDKPIPKYEMSAEDRYLIHVKQPQKFEQNSVKPVFSVPMIAGPLIKDVSTGELKVDGFFLKMEGTLV